MWKWNGVTELLSNKKRMYVHVIGFWVRVFLLIWLIQAYIVLHHGYSSSYDSEFYPVVFQSV